MKKANLIMSLIMIFTFISCVTYKADSLSVSTPDYNQRVQVSTPHYDGVLNTIGVASIASTTIAGGYLGYQSDLIKYNSGGEQATSRIGNALIGASIGFGTSYLMNRLFGWGKSKPVYDAQEWVYKANKNMILISETSNGLYLIPKNADQNYQIKNIADAKEFKSVFNNSTNQDSVFKTGIVNCKRNELPELIDLYPSTPSLISAKDKYIISSPTYSEIVNAVTRYSEVKKDYELNFLNLVAKSTDAIDFKTRYNNSTNLKRAYFNAYKTDNQQKESIVNLNNAYLNSFDFKFQDLKNETAVIQRNFTNSQYLLSDSKTIYDLITIYNRFTFLNFQERNIDFLNSTFNFFNKTIENGNEVLWNFKRLSNKEIYPTLTVNKNDIEGVVNQRLTEELTKNVFIISQKQLSNANPEWERWKKSNYTAGLVGEKGAMFIMYGEIRNNSKFDIPIELTATAGLKYDIDLGSVARSLGITVTKPVPGTQTSTFYVPSFPSKSTGAYAIRLDFKDNYQRGGINIFDIGKILIEAKLIDVNLSAKYSLTAVSIPNSTIERQKEIQKFVVNGIPNGNLGDLWRGGDVNYKDWEEKDRIRKIEYSKIRTNSHYRINKNVENNSKYENEYDQFLEEGNKDKGKSESELIKEIWKETMEKENNKNGWQLMAF